MLNYYCILFKIITIIERGYWSIPLRYLPTYLDSNPTHSFHTSQKPFLFDSPPTSPSSLSIFRWKRSRSSRRRRRFQSWGQHNNCISPFFHVPWTWSGPFCCRGKKQTEANPTLSVFDPVFTPFPPFRPNRTGETGRCSSRRWNRRSVHITSS